LGDAKERVFYSFMDENQREMEFSIIYRVYLLQALLKTALLHVVLDNNTFCSRVFFIGERSDTCNFVKILVVGRAF
jgi:hypothetical protein